MSAGQIHRERGLDIYNTEMEDHHNNIFVQQLLSQLLLRIILRAILVVYQQELVCQGVIGQLVLFRDNNQSMVLMKVN